MVTSLLNCDFQPQCPVVTTLYTLGQGSANAMRMQCCYILVCLQGRICSFEYEFILLEYKFILTCTSLNPRPFYCKCVFRYHNCVFRWNKNLDDSTYTTKHWKTRWMMKGVNLKSVNMSCFESVPRFVLFGFERGEVYIELCQREVRYILSYIKLKLKQIQQQLI